MPFNGSHDGDDTREDVPDGGERPLDRDDPPLTDLDYELLLDADDPLDPVDLDPEDFTDLDDLLLYFHREEDLRDRYGTLGLLLITALHFLPAAVGVVATRLPIDTTVLAPSIGLDLYFLTGVVAIFSGVAAHLAREYGSRYLLRYALAAIVAGSGVYALALVNAAVAPGTYLTAGGTAAGVFAQLNAGIASLSVIGGLLVVARLVYEYHRGDGHTTSDPQ